MTRTALSRLAISVVGLVSLGASIAGCGSPASTGSATTPAPPATTKAERFAGCDVKPETERWRRIRTRAERAMARGEGFTRATADAWLRTQDLSLQLEDAMRTSSRAGHFDYVDHAFHNSTLTLEWNVRNHDHDAAIRDCARRLRLFGRIEILVHRWTPGQLDQASGRLADALPDLADRGVFATSRTYGDRYNIEIYRKATTAERRQIRAAAERIGVGFKIKELNEDAPVFSVD